MSFFNSLATMVLEGFESNSGTTGAVAKELMQHLQQNNGGGLNDLLGQLKQQGLGEVVRSWVGTGPNQPISADQLSGALNSDMLKQLAGKLGIPPDQLTTHLADILPKIVDRLTPNGQLPTDASVEAATGAAAASR